MSYSIQSTIPTDVAPATRSPPEMVQRQYELTRSLPEAVRFMDAWPTMGLVLNAQRQIVFANRAFLRFGGMQDAAELVGQPQADEVDCIRTAMLGQRPGEAVNCVRASERPGGCGTTVFCRNCGAVRAILNSQARGEDMQDYCLLRKINHHTEALDLCVWARTLEVAGTPFTLFTMADISNEKRRQALEASAAGETVTLNVERTGDQVACTVHNPEVMPEEIRLQIFTRSFSTRGPGRGLGTYGTQLLTERYLVGRISFVSTAAHGIIFIITLPTPRLLPP